MAKFTIEEFMDFEFISRRLIAETLSRQEHKDAMQQLLLKIFLAGYNFGKYGKTELET